LQLALFSPARKTRKFKIAVVEHVIIVEPIFADLPTLSYGSIAKPSASSTTSNAYRL